MTARPTLAACSIVFGNDVQKIVAMGYGYPASRSRSFGSSPVCRCSQNRTPSLLLSRNLFDNSTFEHVNLLKTQLRSLAHHMPAVDSSGGRWSWQKLIRSKAGFSPSLSANNFSPPKLLSSPQVRQVRAPKFPTLRGLFLFADKLRCLSPQQAPARSPRRNGLHVSPSSVDTEASRS